MQKKTTINRRKFLRFSATVGAGAILAPEMAASTLDNLDIVKEEIKIPERTLGRTGVKLPILSMGVDRPDNHNILKAAFASGIFHFDTAYAYQNGKNEVMLGNFFEGKPRDSFFISTKLMFDYPLRDDFEEDMMQRLETSLRRLKVDYVDIFYLHSIHQAEKLNDPRVIAFLKKIKAEKKTRFVGFSSHDQYAHLIDTAIATGIYDVALMTYNFKIKELKEANEAIQRAAESGMGIIAMKTLAGGVEDAEGKKKINAQACLKWVWQNKHITTTIPGLFTYDHLDECLTAAKNSSITPEEQEYLAALYNREMLFCQRCNVCKSQCTKGLPIPDIMRAYMYAYGYKHSQLSKETLAGLNVAQDACADCSECKVNCPSGFNVSKKIAAIMPVVQAPSEFLT